MDLRERVVTAVESGLSRRQVAGLFDVVICPRLGIPNPIHSDRIML
jgi:hypothetical protein